MPSILGLHMQVESGIWARRRWACANVRFAAFEAEKDLGSRETCVCVPLHEAVRSVMGQRKNIRSNY